MKILRVTDYTMQVSPMSCGPMNEQNGAAPRSAFAFGDAANNSSRWRQLQRTPKKLSNQRIKLYKEVWQTEPKNYTPH